MARARAPLKVATGRLLEGKCAIVTGSTQGLGLAIAQRLAAAGSRIVIHGLADPLAGARLCAALENDHNVRAWFSAADLRTRQGAEQLFDDAATAVGECAILVNNAVTRHAAPIESFDPAAWDEAVAVNLSAAFHLTRLAVPRMKKRQWGRIVNVSSIFGLIGAAHRAGYVTTKTGLIGLTRAVALETVADGITCNAVCPGTIETPVHAAAIDALSEREHIPRAEAERRFLASKQPSGRFVGAEGVAALVAFLCGPDAGDITGATLPVDGGWSIA
jgi:3-hydroxybutyrate dehydrogenase